MAVKEISCQERTHYTTFAACFKPVMAEEFAMLSQVEMLSDVMENVNEIIADPFKNLQDSENTTEHLKELPSHCSETQHEVRKIRNVKFQSQSASSSPETREARQSVTKGPGVRSLSPYSVTLATTAENTKITRRPPRPQKVNTVPKPANPSDKDSALQKQPVDKKKHSPHFAAKQGYKARVVFKL